MVAVRCLCNEVTSSELRAAHASASAALLTLLTTLLTLLTVVLLAIVLLTVVLAVVAAIVTTVVAAVAAALVGDCEANTVVLSTTLSHRHKNRLVVSSGGHGADTVRASGKTGSEVGRESSLAITGVVDTLKESKLLGVRRSGSLRVADVLHSDVGVPDNLAALEILRSNVVGNVRVGEFSVASCQQKL